MKNYCMYEYYQCMTNQSALILLSYLSDVCMSIFWVSYLQRQKLLLLKIILCFCQEPSTEPRPIYSVPLTCLIFCDLCLHKLQTSINPSPAFQLPGFLITWALNINKNNHRLLYISSISKKLKSVSIMRTTSRQINKISL